MLSGEPTTPAAVRVRQKKYTISDDLKLGTGEKLFDFLADCVKGFLEDVLKENVEKMKTKKLGFTFSFPVQQTSINHGKPGFE
jgi:hexokinase